MILLLIAAAVFGSLSCKDRNGNDVDYFAILKYPTNAGPDVAGTGYGYAYGDKDTTFADTGDSLQDGSDPLGYTLTQIGDENQLYAYWDDQDPSGAKHASNGHEKGVLAFDGRQGFWLIHSVPRYSDIPYVGYPERETKYGQSFLCLTLGPDSIDMVGMQLKWDGPFFYASNTPENLCSRAPNVCQAINHTDMHTGKDDPTSHIASIMTLDGTSVVSMAHNKHFDEDIYEYLVAETIHSDLYVESWMNGWAEDKLPSYCKPDYKYKVENIQVLTMTDDIHWKETQDHSKWAVPSGSRAPSTVCIGGLNRQRSQGERGGQVSCIKDESLHDAFQKMVTQVDECK